MLVGPDPTKEMEHEAETMLGQEMSLVEEHHLGYYFDQRCFRNADLRIFTLRIVQNLDQELSNERQTELPASNKNIPSHSHTTFPNSNPRPNTENLPCNPSNVGMVSLPGENIRYVNSPFIIWGRVK